MHETSPTWKDTNINNNANLCTPKKVAKNNDRTASGSRARARAYPSQETCYLSCSFARKGSQKKAPRIESLPSVKHPWTTSTLKSYSFIFSRPPHVSLLPDLIFLLHCYKAPPLLFLIGKFEIEF